MKIIDVFRMKIVMFLIQILILSLFIYFTRYEFIIFSFNIKTLGEQAVIIQILANYVLFDKLTDLLLIYTIWIMVSLIPILFYNDFKRAYSMNLMTFFFPNFFLYVFLSRYSVEFFNKYFQFHFLNTLLLGIVIVIFSFVISLIFKKIKISKGGSRIVHLETIAKSISTICPQCGTEFESRPKICFNCNADLTIKLGVSSE
ncbi:hypothetical protein LCGC14_0994940 [marine sediment metagenome]|uniref:Uncharacterized protein n=1 Tax=marine sediment metagenome TaxID=412755 RepID=A0A0F9N9A5_9ZZZZ